MTNVISTLYQLGWLTRIEAVKDGNHEGQSTLPQPTPDASPPRSPRSPPLLLPDSLSPRLPSLLALTLRTLSEYAGQVHEFETMWSRLAERLSYVLTQLFDLEDPSPARGSPVVVDGKSTVERGFDKHNGEDGIKHDGDSENQSKNDGHLLQLAMIVFHFARRKTACSSPNLFARLVTSTDIVTQIRDIHTELTFLEHTVSADLSGVKKVVSADSSKWDPACLVEDETALLGLFRATIAGSGRVAGSWARARAKKPRCSESRSSY